MPKLRPQLLDPALLTDLVVSLVTELTSFRVSQYWRGGLLNQIEPNWQKYKAEEHIGINGQPYTQNVQVRESVEEFHRHNRMINDRIWTREEYRKITADMASFARIHKGTGEPWRSGLYAAWLRFTQLKVAADEVNGLAEAAGLAGGVIDLEIDRREIRYPISVADNGTIEDAVKRPEVLAQLERDQRDDYVMTVVARFPPPMNRFAYRLGEFRVARSIHTGRMWKEDENDNHVLRKYLRRHAYRWIRIVTAQRDKVLATWGWTTDDIHRFDYRDTDNDWNDDEDVEKIQPQPEAVAADWRKHPETVIQLNQVQGSVRIAGREESVEEAGMRILIALLKAKTKTVKFRQMGFANSSDGSRAKKRLPTLVQPYIEGTPGRGLSLARYPRV
jgi:hypothetical protein